MSKTYFVYITSNKSRRLYTGITSDLVARVFQHKNKWHEGSFTGRYGFDMLVYLEAFSNPHEAIAREKEIKGWRREKKLPLVLSANPDWADLSAEWREDESWQAIAEGQSRQVFRRQRSQS
jgi:putative endonuclease